MVYDDSKYEHIVIHDTKTYSYGMYTTIRSRIQYTHREHSPLSHLRPTKGKVAKFTSSRRRTLVNALFHKSHTHPLSPSGFLRKNAIAKIIIFFEIYANISNYFCIFAEKVVKPIKMQLLRLHISDSLTMTRHLITIANASIR